MKHLFTAETWIAWLAATVVAAFTMAAYAFTTFSTKEEATRFEGTVEKRLDRIEYKVDKILERGN